MVRYVPPGLTSWSSSSSSSSSLSANGTATEAPLGRSSHPHTVPQSFDDGRFVWLGGHRHDECWSALGAKEGRDYTSRNDVWTSDGLQSLLDTNGIFIVFAKGKIYSTSYYY